MPLFVYFICVDFLKMANGSAGFRGTDYQSYCAAIRILEITLEQGVSIDWVKFESEEDFTIQWKKTFRKVIDNGCRVTKEDHCEYCQTKNEIYFPKGKLEGVLDHYLSRVGDSSKKNLLVYIGGNLGKNIVGAPGGVSGMLDKSKYDTDFLKRVSVLKLPCYPYIVRVLMDFLFQTLGIGMSREQLNNVRAHFIEGLNFLFGERYKIYGQHVQQQIETWKNKKPEWGKIFGIPFDKFRLEEQPINVLGSDND